MSNPSRREIPKTRAALIATLQKAMSAQTPNLSPLSEEQLALLCLGQSNDIPPADRRQLLDLIASDPQIAGLVADLRSAGWGADAMPSDVATIIYRISAWTCAAAAIVFLGLGAWRIVSPPSTAAPAGQTIAIAPPPQTPSSPMNPSPPTNVGNNQNQNPVQGQFIQPQPPAQTPAPTPPSPTPSSSGFASRDIALIASLAIAILLTPFAILWTRFHRARQFPIN